MSISFYATKDFRRCVVCTDKQCFTVSVSWSVLHKCFCRCTSVYVAFTPCTDSFSSLFILSLNGITDKMVLYAITISCFLVIIYRFFLVFQLSNTKKTTFILPNQTKSLQNIRLHPRTYCILQTIEVPIPLQELHGKPV